MKSGEFGVIGHVGMLCLKGYFSGRVSVSNFCQVSLLDQVRIIATCVPSNCSFASFECAFLRGSGVGV